MRFMPITFAVQESYQGRSLALIKKILKKIYELNKSMLDFLLA